MATTRRKPIARISGIGITEFSRRFDQAAPALAAGAAVAAVADAGLEKADIDGLFINRSSAAPKNLLTLRVQDDLGLRDLRLLNMFASEAISGIQMVQYAALAVQAGMARHVVCVFADTPIMPEQTGGDAYAETLGIMRVPGWEDSYGLFGAVGAYGLAMRRYMHCYGATPEHFAAVAIATRQWAERNPLAMLRKSLTVEDYLASRLIADPIRMLDCAYPVNGGAAVIVSALDAGGGEERGSAYIWAAAQGHRPYSPYGGYDNETATAAGIAAAQVFGTVGIGPADIDHVHIYDAFTYTTMIGLEEYGFCRRGEAKDFVAAGGIAPGGALPCNTGGGQLSGYYLQGLTQISEAYLQVTGQATGRQLDGNDWVLVTNQGGRMDYHAALILSRNPA